MTTGMKIGAAIGVCIFTGVWFKGDFFSAFFTGDPAVVRASWNYLINAIAYAIYTRRHPNGI